MKKETYSINEKLQLVCDYELYSGKTGQYIFDIKLKDGDRSQPFYISGKIEGTKYSFSSMRYCNLCKCYVPVYNNTRLVLFVPSEVISQYIDKYHWQEVGQYA